jgi:hypothetical protein
MVTLMVVVNRSVRSSNCKRLGATGGLGNRLIAPTNTRRLIVPSRTPLSVGHVWRNPNFYQRAAA